MGSSRYVAFGRWSYGHVVMTSPNRALLGCGVVVGGGAPWGVGVLRQGPRDIIFILGLGKAYNKPAPERGWFGELGLSAHFPLLGTPFAPTLP
jgi:hypothetical protein